MSERARPTGGLSYRLGERTRALVGAYATEAGRQALRNLVGLLAWTALWQTSTVGTVAFLSRGLDPEEFGILNFALTWQTYLTLLGSLACESVVIREGLQRPDDLDDIATSFLILTAISSVLVCAASLVVVGLGPMSGGERRLLALVAVGSVPASVNIQPLFDVHHSQARVVAVGAVAEVLGLLAVTWLWWSGGLTLPTLGGVYAAKWGLASAGQLLMYHAGVRRLRWRYSPPDTTRILELSWLAALLFPLPLSGSVLLVRLRGGPGDAALVGLGYQVANACMVLGGLGLQVVQPHIAGQYGLHPGFLRKLALFAVLLLGSLAALAFAGGQTVVRFLLPPIYEAAIPPMAWLLAASVPLLVARIAHVYLVPFEDGAFILTAHLASALLYVSGCLLLPLAWVKTGAAVLAPCTVLVAAAACLWRVRRRIREGTSG